MMKSSHKQGTLLFPSCPSAHRYSIDLLLVVRCIARIDLPCLLLVY
jgi:hypothetical protein